MLILPASANESEERFAPRRVRTESRRRAWALPVFARDNAS